MDKLKQFFDIKFWKFILVGIINTIIGMGLQFVFYNVFGWDKYDWGVILASFLGNFIGSVVSFFLNKKLIGMWTSPGDFGDVPGIFTPDWWFPNWNQYGLLKLLVINRKGTFIDGLQISDVTTTALNLDYTSTIRLKMAVEETSKHVGGLTIFGKTFGNYDQDINVNLNYSPIPQ